MSTRSIVFARTESGLKGVYVHWDGYPQGRLPVLHEMIRRDGVSKTVSTIVASPSGWSHLNPLQGSELEPMYDDGRFIAVPGYGVKYNDQPVEFHGREIIQGDTEYRTPEMSQDVFIEFMYVIEEDGTITWAENDFTRPFNRQVWKVSKMADVS